jgi:hypothetical protein
MANTEVMLIGSLPAGSMPGAGGPMYTVTPPYAQRDWFINRTMVPPVSPSQPQNLLRISDKSLSNRMASTGRPFTSALGGLAGGPIAMLGDAAATAPTDPIPPEAYKQSLYFCAGGMALLGGTMAALHGYRRNKGKMGWTLLWWVLGSAFPLPTNAVALIQGYGKAKG